MKRVSFAALSDIHEHYPIQPKAVDCLAFAGDVFASKKPNDSTELNIPLQIREFFAFIEWLSFLPADHFIMIAGNHDYLFESFGNEIGETINSLLRTDRIQAREAVQGSGLNKKHKIEFIEAIEKASLSKSDSFPKVVYLNNSSYSYKGINIWGTPYSVLSPDNIYPKTRAFTLTGEEYIDNVSIPRNTDIAISHCSANLKPELFIDNPKAANFLRDEILKQQPAVVVSGHYHWLRGEYELDNTKVLVPAAAKPYDWSGELRVVESVKDPYYYFSMPVL